MTDALVIKVDDAQVQRWFGELLRRATDLSPLMAAIGESVLESTQGRFRTGTGPDGVAWVPLADGSGRTPLTDTGRMWQDISPRAGPNWMELTAHARQARWHQKGTPAYTITPKGKKALAWPGGPGPRKKVNHPGLPARPFMGISAEDDQRIGDLGIAWLELGRA
ncbi:phage virion morphogenesis protein [Pseudoxanthomonas mexicana]|uniref:phage virion morphogenesis protein n=1 Tax=Pseudoxanthomonas mexicana TaxID=128785 RepID=UPI00398A9DF1